MTISRRKESTTTLETLTGQARFGKLLKTLSPSSSQVMLCHIMVNGGGYQVFLSGIACLFGSCMGSDKGAM